jgi:hypothetical protein
VFVSDSITIGVPPLFINSRTSPVARFGFALLV